ncbi:MAG TPA: SpaA isopeptide-forming pilin-related protein, partial [Acidimicrobiales bacterium]
MLPRKNWRRTTERPADSVDVSSRLAPYRSTTRPAGRVRAALTRAVGRPLPFGAAREADDVVGRLRPVPLAEAIASSGPARFTTAPSGRRSARRHVPKVAIATAFALLIGATGALPAAALVVSPGTNEGFEIDGDFDVDNPNNIDWETADAAIVEDDTIDSAFQGSSKEEQPGSWVCQAHAGGVTPGKDNLLRAYVDARFEGEEAFLDLGLVRAEGEGDTHVNFEFNRSGVPQETGDYQDGPCPITREVGDFLVAVDFGGTSFLTAEIRLFTWDGSEWDEITSGFTAYGANNTSDIADDPMVDGIQFVEERTFIEVSVQLPDGFLTCPGFSLVNVRSRSSHSITSALQDKMPTTSVDVSTCGKILLHKQDDLGQPLAGAVFGLFNTAAATGTPVDTCTSAADGTCSFDEVTPGTYWVREISAPTGFNPDPDIVEVTVGFREEVEITQPFEDPLILGSVLIRKTHALGGPVAGVRFILRLPGTTTQATDRDGDPAECTTGADGTCTIDRLVPGTYTVHEDPATVPATMTPAPDQNVTVVGNQTVEVAFVNPVKPLAIQIVKTVNDEESVTIHSGDEVTYKLVITNTGQQALTLTSLTDVANDIPLTLAASCASLVNNTPLAPGGTRTCTYKANPEDDVHNVATVVGRDAFNRTATDDDDANVDVINPDISLTKTVNGAESVTVHEGDALTYVVTFTNTGDTPLRITTLTDTVNGTLATMSASCQALVNSTLLAPGASRSCEYTTSAPATGQVNTARVIGIDVLGGEVDADDTAVATVINPAISLVKTVNGAES